jgi:16S rRNA A1518/A1519 N6-dimethyltransferase RsmA/KsgA/DIM1 with predicted DNA glycosylase/AP lyase activity
MLFDKIRNGIEISDKEFDLLLPESIRKQAEIHWTPFEIIQKCADFITQENCKNILDIGSGVGKFCMITSALTGAKITGVEIRKNLHLYAQSIAQSYLLSQVSFINQNITETDFSPYDCFYYYNPFFENIVLENTIDSAIPLKTQAFNAYTQFVKNELEKKEKGTCLMSYFTSHEHIPNAYQLIEHDENLSLSFWKKR